MFEKKRYQERSLLALEEYFDLARREDAERAFYEITREREGRGREYLRVPRLPGLPYVCLRVPTGGGKTFMACHALGIAARSYVQAERVVCLWLVPTNTVKDQTLAALREKRHPYRQALDSWFAGRVEVMTLAEALTASRATLSGNTCVIVSTLAAPRVEDTGIRKMYESYGSLRPHFLGLAPERAAKLEKLEDGTVKYSLENVLRLHRPVVVMDEAHNARTPLSFDTLARFDPSCIIEFTATPEKEHRPGQGQYASNVLCHVSAQELRDEEMIKLPIRLHERSDWREVVAEAVERRAALEKVAQKEERETGDYIRPIALVQAQPRSKDRETLTVDVVRRFLTDQCKVPEDWIAEATSENDETSGVDIFDRACPLRFVITVQKLREGWDCSFAYVLCTVSEIHTPTAVEQVLGRILRLPGAAKRRRAELNRAYAFATSPRFADTAKMLVDALVENGFEKYEAQTVIEHETEQMRLGEGEFELAVVTSVTLPETPDLAGLGEALAERVSFDARTKTITLTGVATEREEEELVGAVAGDAARAEMARLCREARARASRSSPHDRGQPFEVPQIAVRAEEQLELFDEEHFLDRPWNVREWPATLTEAEFPTRRDEGRASEVDLDEEGKVKVFSARLYEDIRLIDDDRGWAVADLVGFLDRQIPHPDITHADSSAYLHEVVRRLIEERGLSVDQLARERFRLREAVRLLIERNRREARKASHQEVLFDREDRVEVGPEVRFSFKDVEYSPNRCYDGSYEFQKHYCRQVGDLDGDGEEFECARFIDAMDEVVYWVRNLAGGGRERTSFWLQTYTDKFYPDFVALLKDGRVLVVEYKGADRWSDDDSREKRALGEIWARRSGGMCLFVMPNGRDFGTMEAAVRGGAAGS